jgi:hypothetical protein
MTLYTLMIFIPILFYFWSDRRRPGFQLGLLLALFLHGIVLFLIRSGFPLGPKFFLIVPVALIEGAAAATLILKLLGNRETS